MDDAQIKSNSEVEVSFKLKVSSDKLKVFLSSSSVSGDIDSLVERIFIKLREINVTAMPNDEALMKVLKESQADGSEIENFVLVEGIPVEMPVDGKLEWSGDYFNDGYYIDPETKKIDFQRRIGDPNVEKDTLLVKVTHDKLGKDGKDVFGNVIRVRPPNKVILNGGLNVFWDKDTSGFYSKTAGRVKMKGKTVDIDETLILKDGVGKETGSVSHKGYVVVKGDVDSDRNVEATGDIEVRGMIYSCDIKCGGNLICKEGMNENIAKKVEVEGNILTKYIMNANVESHGNIIVNKEIFQSTIKTKGEVTCEKGRILGGEITAAKGICVGEAGSKGNANTLLIAGIDFQLQEKLKTNDSNIEKLKDALKQIRPVYKQLENMKNFLNAAQKEKLTELDFKITEINNGIESLDNENKGIRKEIYSNKDARIIIKDLLYPGVVLRIFDSQYIVDNVLAGPIVAELDPVTTEIALTSNLEEDK